MLFLGLPYKILGSAEDFEKLKTTTDIFILGVFDSLESPNAQDYIKFVAEDSEDHKYEYAVTSEASVKEFLAFSGNTNKLLFYKHENKYKMG